MGKINKFTRLIILICINLICSFTKTYSQEIGLASYYADKFEGQKTANGELYDHEKLTAAHRTIPFGTVLRVTNMRTQNSVIVRVNDRGPFNKRFVIDLSKEAAKAIDIHDGSQDVKIEILENTVIGEVSIHDIGKPKDTITENKIAPVVIEEKKSEAIAPQKQKTADSDSKEVALLKNIYKIESVELPENQFVIKLGKFENFDKVTDFLKKHKLNNLPNTLIYLDKENKDLDYYVLVGPFYDKIEAKNFQKTLKKDLKNSIVSLKSLDKDK